MKQFFKQYQHRTDEQIEEAIRYAFKKPPLDGFNQVLVGETLASVGLASNPRNRSIFYKVCEDLGYKATTKLKNQLKRHGQAIVGGMPLGEKTKKLPWNVIASPAIYAIINKENGMRYIGYSKRPDLKRSVHYFFLNNLWKPASSNVFLGNDKIKADVAEFGVEAFYFEILQPLPNLTPAEYVAIKQEYMNKLDVNKLYNIAAMQNKKSTRKLARHINPEWVKANAEYQKLKEKAKACQLNPSSCDTSVNKLIRKAREVRKLRQSMPMYLV